LYKFWLSQYTNVRRKIFDFTFLTFFNFWKEKRLKIFAVSISPFSFLPQKRETEKARRCG